MFWNDEQIATLKKMRLAGFSASQIACNLGGAFSRSAVCGKIHRLGLSLPQPKQPKQPKQSRTCKQKRPRATGFEALSLPQRAQRLALRIVPIVETPEQPGCNLLELTMDRCRWPIGEPGSEGFGYCGGVREVGSYCTAHARIVYVPVKKRKR